MSNICLDEETVENSVIEPTEIREETKQDNQHIILLEKIKTKIESMNKQHHIQILKILKKNNSVKLNENKSGVFVNLSFLQKETIDDIIKYIDYIGAQEDSIRCIENQRDEFKNTFFHEKEIKDNTLLYNSLKL